jgi:hypothetical protein
MLIEQKIPLVEVYRRSGGEWSFEEFDKKADVIDFPSLNYRIALGDIYEGVAEVEF